MNEYSSLRLEINGELKHSIVDWGYTHISDSDIFSHIDYPYLGREDKTHCTVLYNIIDTSPEQVQKILLGEPSFEILLGELSVFENDMFDVFKINVSGDGLDRLHRIVRDTFHHDPLYFEFSPHITIAFMKKNKGKQLLEKVDKKKFAGKKFKVNSLCFNKYREDETIIGLGV